MRFAIAVAVLVKTLPTNSLVSGDVKARQDTKEVLRSLLQSPSFDHPRIALGAGWKRNNGNAFIGTRKVTKGRRLINSLSNEDAISIECNPDVGLLSCSLGQHCEESRHSVLGGLCAPLLVEDHRTLQDNITLSPIEIPTNETDGTGPSVYCDPDSTYFGDMDCDCDEWDLENGNGTIICALYSDYCDESCQEVCFDSDIIYQFESGVTSVTFCYNFNTPYDQSFCYGYSSDQTCELSLNEESCSSCNTTFTLSCTNGTCKSQTCAEFDCENVGLGSGNTCEDTVNAPILDYCRCSICPDNVIAYPNAVIGLPGYSGIYNCSYVGSSATEGSFSSLQCAEATALATSYCCEKTEPPFVCNICREEGYSMTIPDGVVSIPNQPDQTCSQLQLAAEEIAEEQQCSLFQNFAVDSCGCKGADGGAPVDSTAAPTVEPGTVVENPTAALSLDSSASYRSMGGTVVGFLVVGLSMYAA